MGPGFQAVAASQTGSCTPPPPCTMCMTQESVPISEQVPENADSLVDILSGDWSKR